VPGLLNECSHLCDKNYIKRSQGECRGSRVKKSHEKQPLDLLVEEVGKSWKSKVD
jgi:hypothetical protein